MKITQLNAKANVKTRTDQDKPINPKFPIINEYVAESTLNQTIVNLNFSIEIANKEQFFLYVDGKRLLEGSLNDFTFTNIQFGRSSQITLASPLAAGLNIIANKLGLKEESSLYLDQAFIQSQNYIDSGLKAFIKLGTMTPTATTGTPAANTFYSNIQSRAEIPNLETDGLLRYGSKRMMTQTLIPMENEMGVLNQRVSKITNDEQDQIRFVGNWIQTINTNGYRAQTITQNDYAEIVFRGTGLNVLLFPEATNNPDLRYSINGGADSVAALTGLLSAATAGRYYNTNTVVNVVSGLPFGTYTLILRKNANNAGIFAVYGVDILDERSSILATANTGYMAGKESITSDILTTLNTQFTNVYNSVSTKGGKVIVYKNPAGEVLKDVRYVDAVSRSGLTTDHSREEAFANLSPRQFSASGNPAGTDFGVGLTVTNGYFTLDDGSTSFYANNGAFQTLNGIEGFVLTNNGDNLSLSFEGTGLDLSFSAPAAPTNATVTIDNDPALTFTISFDANTARTYRIASDLPYGSHTVKITRIAAGNFPNLYRMILYNTKTPALPAGNLKQGEYNLLSDYVPTALANPASLSYGVISKASYKESAFTGTWTLTNNGTVRNVGYMLSSTNASTFTNNFYGKGFEITANSAGTVTATITINGVLYTGAATVIGGGSWVPGTSTWTLPTTNGGRIQITGLPEGKQTVLVTLVSAAAGFNYHAFDYQTSISSGLTTMKMTDQNTLISGSNSILVSRVFDAEKDNSIFVSRSTGTIVNQIVSTTAIPVADMILPFVSRTGKAKVNYSVYLTDNSANQGSFLVLYVNGKIVGTRKNFTVSGNNGTVSDYIIIDVPKGLNSIIMQAYVGAGAGNINIQPERNLTVEEVL